MAQGHDQKEFLDLLQPFKSDGMKKARRNFTFVGFLVVSAWALGINLTKIRVFGIDLSSSSELYILSITLILLIYWAGMFLLSHKHDAEIQKEREIQLNVIVEELLNRWKALEDERIKREKTKSNFRHIPPDYGKIKAAVQAYEQQKDRTEKAAKYSNLIYSLELYTPISIGGAAAIVLLSRIWLLLY